MMPTSFMNWHLKERTKMDKSINALRILVGTICFSCYIILWAGLILTMIGFMLDAVMFNMTRTTTWIFGRGNIISQLLSRWRKRSRTFSTIPKSHLVSFRSIALSQKGFCIQSGQSLPTTKPLKIFTRTCCTKTRNENPPGGRLMKVLLSNGSLTRRKQRSRHGGLLTLCLPQGTIR